MTAEDKVRNALEWARTQLGRYVQPCHILGCKFNQAEPGAVACQTPTQKPDKDEGNMEDGHPYWNFYCMRFVRTAYGAPAKYAKAKDMYEDLRTRSLISTDTNIPVGALVFWSWAEFGHIGIHVGGSKIIHTGVNRRLKTKGVRESPLSDIAGVLGKDSYVGWAHPPQDWPGRTV